MRMTRYGLLWFVLGVCAWTGNVQAAGTLGVTDAWIRVAPPGATMLAGYAKLKNTGDAPLTILTVQSPAFRMATLHETIVSDGMSKMRELHRLVIAAGESIAFAPGGKHLMLMDARQAINAGDRIEVTFLLTDGTRVKTYFDVVSTGAD